MSLGNLFKSEVGGIVAQGSLSDGIVGLMEQKLDASHNRHDPALTAVLGKNHVATFDA